MTSPFYRLAPFIQEYIYREKWSELRPIQVQAIEAILDRSSHVLITSGTASGKTEAAFLPILSDLYERPPNSIGAIYVGPLKALINDQFYRLQGLLEDSGIPVQSWHGDVAQSKKQKFLRGGRGILQITPESLEAMLINRQTELRNLFGELRYVVIDEVHALIGSDRGRQVLCQLQRLARYQARPARRIGLSATLGEPATAMAWLGGGTDFEVEHLNDAQGRREIMLALEHFLRERDPAEDDDDTEPVDEPEALETTTAEEPEEAPEGLAWDESNALYEHMYAMVQSAKKTLIFANSRNETEEIINNLRRLSGTDNKDEDGYYVHHGSISAALREQAEDDMRDPEKSTCIAATITLELGIDIGNLDQVLQLNATSTVSSFVQRLGRSGRRDSPAKMFFYCREDRAEDTASLGKRIPWGMLQTIAIIQLYVEEKWIEPPNIPKLPVSLLYHQTMSAVVSRTELTPAELAESVLTLSPFAGVSTDQFRGLLRHLLTTEHLERIEGGGLIVGSAAERIVNNYHFFATFQDEMSYQVREGTREIGNIQSLPEIGDRFALAGRAWAVVSIDEDRHLIQVVRVRGRAKTGWTGGGAWIHTHVLERMCRALKEDTEYVYLQPRASERLFAARRLARGSGMTTQSIVETGGNSYMLLPWQGSNVIDTMSLLLQHWGISVRGSDIPYYLEVSGSSQDTLRANLQKIVDAPPSAEALIEKRKRYDLQRNKYDRYVPEDLLRTAYATDQIDVRDAVLSLASLIR